LSFDAGNGFGGATGVSWDVWQAPATVSATLITATDLAAFLDRGAGRVGEPDRSSGLEDWTRGGSPRHTVPGWNAVRVEEPRQALEHRNRLEQARNKGNVPAKSALRLALRRERESWNRIIIIRGCPRVAPGCVYALICLLPWIFCSSVPTILNYCF